MTDDSLSSKRKIFLLPPTAFFCIRQTGDPLHQQGGDFSRHIGWELGKILTWWEKFRHGGKNSSLEMGHDGRKNSHIFGKIPTWLEKKTGRGLHEGIINQVILFKFPYMSWSLILSNYNSILSFSVTCHTWQPSTSLSFCPFFYVLVYHRERILKTSTLSCNEEKEEITKPPTK